MTDRAIPLPPYPWRHRLSVMLALPLAACTTVGPDYVPPSLPTPQAWSRQADAGAADPAALAAWWRTLGDFRLTGLVGRALADSPDLASARARLEEARARHALARAQFAPTLDAGVSGGRTRSSAESGTGGTRDSFSLGLDAGWEPDLFGGKRRGEQAARADLEAGAADLQAARVSLAAEVALAYVELRAYQQRLAIARDSLASRAESLQLTQWRAQAGLTTELDVDQARTTLEQVRATLPALESGLVQAMDRLAVLTGSVPGTLDAELATPGSIPPVPERVEIGIPAETLRRRPDVRAAERSLEAETARIGVAEAARWPGLGLSAGLGREALELGGLSAGGATTASLLASLSAPLFDGGRLKRQVEIQKSVRDQALAAYRSVVLGALEEVENAAAALGNGRRRCRALRRATVSAKAAAAAAGQQYSAGITDFQTVLDTQRTLLSVQDELAQAEAATATALVQLYQALGGGWQPLAVEDRAP